jgi:hypothetical protein
VLLAAVEDEIGEMLRLHSILFAQCRYAANA